MLKPPSTAPFIAPKTLAPVLVFIKPTSRLQRKAFGPSSAGSTLYSSPFASFNPSYKRSNPSFFNNYLRTINIQLNKLPD